VRFWQDEMMELVMGNCQLCHRDVVEVRILQFEPPVCKLKKVIKLQTSLNADISYGPACSLFRTHLNQVKRFERKLFYLLNLFEFKKLDLL
jgi:hypothetical protein